MRNRTRVVFAALTILLTTVLTSGCWLAEVGPTTPPEQQTVLDWYTFRETRTCNNQHVTEGWAGNFDFIINGTGPFTGLSGTTWSITNCTFDRQVTIAAMDANVPNGSGGWAPNPSFVPPVFDIKLSRFTGGISINTPTAGNIQANEFMVRSAITDYPLSETTGTVCPGRLYDLNIELNYWYTPHAPWNGVGEKPHTEALHVFGGCPSGMRFNGNHFVQQGPFQYITSTGAVNVGAANTTWTSNWFGYTVDENAQVPVAPPTANYTVNMFGPGNTLTGGCIQTGSTAPAAGQFRFPGDLNYNSTLDPYPIAPTNVKDCLTGATLWP